MSKDARESIYLWLASLTFFGVCWAALRFDFLRGFPDKWLWPLVGLGTVVNLLCSLLRWWKHRASLPGKANNS